jgi:hypothetical protein
MAKTTFPKNIYAINSLDAKINQSIKNQIK